jgi:hypothetical protein
MQSNYAAFVFGALALVAVSAAVNDLGRGVASTNGMWTFSVATNPVGFYFAVATKVFIFGFCIAELLHRAGLIGDPLDPLNDVLHAFGLR